MLMSFVKHLLELPLSVTANLLVDFTLKEMQNFSITSVMAGGESNTLLASSLPSLFFVSLALPHIWGCTTSVQSVDELKCLRARQKKRGTCHCASARFLTATHRCSAVAMDTVPPLPSAGGYGGMGLERRGGSGYTAPASSPYQCSSELPPPFPFSPPLFSLII